MTAPDWSPRQKFARDLMAIICHYSTVDAPYAHPRQILHNGKKARR